MATVESEFLRAKLVERREKLQAAVVAPQANPALAQLLERVDAALDSMDKGTYGLCESCHESVEKDRLLADPLTRLCLDHLTVAEQRALEEDLELAARIQRALLPPKDLSVGGWQAYYHYMPLGLVSGDYCDLIHPDGGSGELVFLLGDVSGKGVAASMLMTQLHAMFRSLATVGLSLDQLVGRANRLFCETTLAGHYATLVSGRLGRTGEVEISSAGHPPVFVLTKQGVTQVESTGVPLGMFCDSTYSVERLKLAPGATLFLYSDGLVEARDPSGNEYGFGRLAEFVARQDTPTPQALTAACLNELRAFTAAAPRLDDLTVLAIQRVG